MDTNILTEKFARMGARLKLVGFRNRGWVRSVTGTVSVDIQEDRDGEFFELFARSGTAPTLEVLDVRPSDRHLLLLIREGDDKQKLLCGHDERHWFVAAIPESAPVGTVQQAKEALKPPEVRNAESRAHVKGSARNRRKNAAFRRQGEWFFLPVDNLQVDPKLVLRNEPIRRGNGGKPHWVDFCFRTGGETVYVSNLYPNGLTEAEYQTSLRRNPALKNLPWQVMKRDAAVYVRGRVRHADHATITLHGWHRVVMNTETQSKAMRNVAFLD